MAGQTTIDEPGMRVAENLCVTNHAFVIGPAFPGTDEGLFQRRRAHQRRIGIKRLEIEPDRKSFAQLRAIVQLEHWDHGVLVVADIVTLQCYIRRDALLPWDLDAL